MVAKVKVSELPAADETLPSTTGVTQGGSSKRATLRTAAYRHAAAPGTASAGQVPTANSDGVIVQQDGGLGLVPDAGTEKYIGNQNGVWGFWEFATGKIPVWNPATTYNANDIVVAAEADDSRMYRSKIANNTSALNVSDSWAALGTPPPDSNPVDLAGIDATGAEQFKLLGVAEDGSDMQWVYVTPRTMNAGEAGINAVLISEGAEQMRWGLVDTSQLKDGSVTQSKLAAGVSLPVAFSTLTGIGGTQENGKVVVATSATTQEWQTPSQASVADGSITNSKIASDADIDLDKLDIKGSKSAGKVIKVSGNGNDFEYADDATGGGGGGGLPAGGITNANVANNADIDIDKLDIDGTKAAGKIIQVASNGDDFEYGDKGGGSGGGLAAATRAEVRAGTSDQRAVTPYALNRLREEAVGTFEAQFGDWLTKQSIQNTNLQTLATQAEITLHTSGDSRTINPSGATELAMISGGVSNLPVTIVHGLIFYYGGDTSQKWLYAQENATSIKFYKLVSNSWTAVSTTSDELRYHYAGLPLDNHYYPMAQGASVEDAPPPGASLPFTLGHRAADTGLRLIAWGYNITNNTHILITDQRHHRADVQAGSIDNDDIASNADIDLDKLDINGTKAAGKIIKVASNGSDFEYGDAGSGGSGSSLWGTPTPLIEIEYSDLNDNHDIFWLHKQGSFDAKTEPLVSGAIVTGSFTNGPTPSNSWGTIAYDGTTRWIVTLHPSSYAPLIYKLSGSDWVGVTNTASELPTDATAVTGRKAFVMNRNGVNMPGANTDADRSGVVAIKTPSTIQYIIYHARGGNSLVRGSVSYYRRELELIYSGTLTSSFTSPATLISGKYFNDYQRLMITTTLAGEPTFVEYPIYGFAYPGITRSLESLRRWLLRGLTNYEFTYLDQRRFYISRPQESSTGNITIVGEKLI